MCDNKIFNVNGRGLDRLIQAFELVEENKTRMGFRGCLIDKDIGLIWVRMACDGATMYPVPLTPRQAAEISFTWLSSKEAQSVPCTGLDANYDHDGHNELGWRAFVGEWGRVGTAGIATLIAVKPAYLWYGK